MFFEMVNFESGVPIINVKTPFKLNTYLLWILPIIFSITGILIVFLYSKNSRKKIQKIKF